jgi:two-component system response regulator (stage 0 sporulation protein F)
MSVQLKVLILDDHAGFRRMIREVLPAGTQCLECANGTEGIAAFTQFRPDWVLMDIKMPGIDGLEATRLIRQSDPQARVVIVSQYGDADLRQAAASAGAVHYYLKDQLNQVAALLRGNNPTETVS